MSFILDALKKSEAERQRQAGPTLLEVRVLPPRRKLPTWAIVVAALLGANLVALMWFVVHRPAQGAANPAAATPSAPRASAAPPAASPPAVSIAAAAGTAAANLAAGAAAADGTEPALAVAPAREPPTAPSADDRNPADFAPALPSGGGTVTLQHDLQSLPNFSDIAGLPSLHLDLHVYSPSVPERYAFINMHKVHEGDVLPEGPRVIQITHEGVVLDYRGQEFILGQQP
jgi:general secretion pathway protein B